MRFYNTFYNIEQLFAAGIHYGHKKCLWNPKMAPYIYGAKNGIHVFDLRQTAAMLERALNMIKNVASQNGRILFVSTKKSVSTIIADAAQSCGQYYINNKWPGGMLTNWVTVSASIKRLKECESLLNNPKIEMTKKERLWLSRKYDKLNAVLGGIREMGGLPDILFVIDIKANAIAVQEAVHLGIPVCAIVDSNCDPSNINFLICGNDDSCTAIEFYCNIVSKAILEGIRESLKRSGMNIGDVDVLSGKNALLSKNHKN